MIAFHEYIKPETSTFNVRVPSLYLDNRKFHFERLTMVPNLLSREAAGYEVESAEENLIIYKTGIRLDLQYLDAKKVFPSFKLGGASVQANVAVFLRKLHKHFEDKKPDYIQKCPPIF